MNQLPKQHKNFRISTPPLDKERILDNRPLQGGSLLIHQIDLQRQDDMVSSNENTSLAYIGDQGV